jgi:HAD superfamily hydrolase (TIGR01490 family)
MSEKRKFAVFDIDGTFYRDSLFLDVVNQLESQGLLNTEKVAEHKVREAKWRARRHKQTYNEYLEATVETMMDSMSHLTPKDVESAAEAVASRRMEHVYSFTRDLAKQLKKQGYFLIAISGSQEEIVKHFVKFYEFDAYACTEWHRSDDGEKYTGSAVVKKNNKEKYLQEIIEAHSLQVAGSYAVGDSAGDISMLGFVEHPIAFNPEDVLFETAKEHGWKIVIERKNVIYTLEPQDGSYVLA